MNREKKKNNSVLMTKRKLKIAGMQFLMVCNILMRIQILKRQRIIHHPFTHAKFSEKLNFLEQMLIA